MRLRTPFAGAFLFLVFLSAYVGLSDIRIAAVNDKVLRLLTFFILTLCFYWVLDTSRRRALNLTLIVCTIALGIGSEFVRGFLPNNGRTLDPYDLLVNIAGSIAALALCSWYHKRMLERRRQAKHYHAVPGGDEGVDVELGESLDRSEELENATVARSLNAHVDEPDEHGSKTTPVEILSPLGARETNV